MNDRNQTRKTMKNIQGTIQLAKSRLEYAREIVISLEQNPELLPELLIALELTEEELYIQLSNPEKGNITTYDQALVLLKRRTNNKMNI